MLMYDSELVVAKVQDRDRIGSLLVASTSRSNRPSVNANCPARALAAAPERAFFASSQILIAEAPASGANTHLVATVTLTAGSSTLANGRNAGLKVTAEPV
jgi:hypothetical protein